MNKAGVSSNAHTGNDLTVKTERLIALGLFLLVAFLYFLLRSAYQSGDSLTYAWSIRTGENLFHPHHLLFSPIIRLLYLAFNQVGLKIDVLTVAVIHNVFWAAVTVVVFFLILKRITGSLTGATLGAVALLASNGLWCYATEAEVYVPATGCLTVAAYLLVRGNRDGWNVKRLVLLAFFFALAVLYHQTNILFLIPVTFVLLSGDSYNRWCRTATFWIVAILLILVPYVLAYLSGAESPGFTGFVRYGLAYADHPNPGWGTLAHLSPSGVALLLKSQLRNLIWLPPGSSAVVLIAIGTFGALVTAVFVYFLRQSLKSALHRNFRWSIVGWLLAYYLFFLWWLPGEDEFFVTTLVPLLLLFVWTFNDIIRNHNRQILRLLGLLVAGLFVVVVIVTNLSASIFPRHSSRGEDFEQATILNRIAPVNGFILCDYEQQSNLRYYFNRDLVIEFPLVALYARHRGMIPDQFHLLPDRQVIVGQALLIATIGNYLDIDAQGSDSTNMLWSWLLDVREDSDSGSMSCRVISRTQDESQNNYFVLETHRTTYRGWDEIFALLGLGDSG